MNPASCHRRRLPKPVQWLAAALPLCVLALGVLAIRPDWHAAVHVQIADAAPHQAEHSHDAGTAERGCAIELFASGLVDSVASGLPELKPFEIFAFTRALPAEQPLIALARLEPPGRAPPFLY